MAGVTAGLRKDAQGTAASLCAVGLVIDRRLDRLHREEQDRELRKEIRAEVGSSKCHAQKLVFMCKKYQIAFNGERTG